MDLHQLDGWCRRWLGAKPSRVLFQVTHLSQVVGMELDDGRKVVVKARPPAERIGGCIEVQRSLWRAGFPCPEPLAGPQPFGELLATAESLIEGGEMLAPGPDSSRLFARELARLVNFAPSPGVVPTLDPPPAWIWWQHHEEGIWPKPDDLASDLNAEPGSRWLEDTQQRARSRLLTCDLPFVVGHCDWESQNLRWIGRALHVAHDWDSVACLPEAGIAGAASAVFPTDGRVTAATLEESEAFLRYYAESRGRPWSPAELQIAWAAGLMVLAFNAKKDVVRRAGGPSLAHLKVEAADRLLRAAA